jgi:hypothetical protein
MAKNKNKYRPSIPAPPVHKPASPQASSQDTNTLEKKATEQGLNVPDTSNVALPNENQAELRKKLQALIGTYTVGIEEIEKKKLALLEAEEKISAEKNKLDDDIKQYEETRTCIDNDRLELNKLRNDLNLRETEIVRREADADSGFLERNERSLEKLKDVHHDILVKSEERDKVGLQKFKVEQEAYLTDLKAREKKIIDEETVLREKSLELDRKLRDAQWAEEDANEIKTHLEEHIQARVRKHVEEKDHEIAVINEKTTSLRERNTELERTLISRDEAIKVLGNMSPEAVKRQMDYLNARIKELQDDIANRPTQSEAEELTNLRSLRSTWENDRATLLDEKGRLESRLGRLQIEVDAIEILRDRNKALLENQRLLEAAIDDLRKDIDERLDKHRDQPIYPEMLSMDADHELNEPMSHLYPGSEGIDLSDFSEDLRHRIGSILNGNGGPELYYSPQDVRAFLGGLAMSKLHLLQGISGIGKSSLPRAFAEAVGGFCETISVQAGWRDKNDLFGYFNAFENRFYESNFVQAMYRAQSPKWQHRLAIILLDEMNLSHPEQYGADILDVLERTDERERHFELLSFTPKGQSPKRLKRGRYLQFPKNVWIVGTANHDETTKDFAPKTYDRSMVLELPNEPKPFTLKKVPPRQPIAYTALVEAFEEAAGTYSAEANKAIKWMEDKLRDEFSERFNIGWGGRLESQIRRFLPVVLASGGTTGEAIDHILSSRVLRKIKGKHDNDEADLEAIKSILETTWPDKHCAPSASLRLINKELKHFRG